MNKNLVIIHNSTLCGPQTKGNMAMWPSERKKVVCMSLNYNNLFQMVLRYSHKHPNIIQIYLPCLIRQFYVFAWKFTGWC